MLLGSLTENIFGFAGSYARKQQARLTPILTGWKRWLEFNTTNTNNRLPTRWLMNLGRTGSVSTKTVERAVTWNVGPHGYQRGKEEIHRIFEQGPPIICLQDVRIPKRRKNTVKRELQRLFYRPYVYSVLTALHSAFFPKVTQLRCRHSSQMDPNTRREIEWSSLN